ncbi:MAG TPA: threonine synthase, partial [Candidatus Acidoferrales bacterium]|nr:threonine synthase [Candidatus Acidoferrales bacterium]
CGGLLDVVYDGPRIAPQALRDTWRNRKASGRAEDQSGVWRFRELLPFVAEGQSVVTLGEGRTPLLDVPHSGEWAGGVRLAIKHQGNNPTGSFKDLGMTACITQAAIAGSRVTACASTGNTSASMSAYAIRAGMRAVVAVPAGKISAAKLAQALEFGATVMEIGGSFDAALQLLRVLAGQINLYLVNSLNPFRIEGQKTIVCEIFEQRDWKAPDYIVVPGGNLGNVSAIGKGLCDLNQMGLIEKFPRLVVVQAEGANPFCRMLASGSDQLVPVSEPRTEATAIRIGNPVNWTKALRAIRSTDGLCESVSDAEIFAAKAEFARDGVGCEPASATTLAGLRKLVANGKIERGADVVAVLTGHQLKDPEIGPRRRSEEELASRRISVEPDIGKMRIALEKVLASH